MLKTPMRTGMVIFLACSAAMYAVDKKEKTPDKQIDSGSFGVFVKGRRVVTETFNVQQNDGISNVKSELKEINDSSTSPGNSSGQSSDLKMTGSGELISYAWEDGSGSLQVTPKNDFLLERITTAASPKPAEQPFLMPSTSAILDNNFFVQREVLAWRYLASACKTESGDLKCQRDPGEFGVLVPQDRTSIRVRMELVGKEKVTIHGVERELLRLNLKGENFSWALWLDDKDKFKLMRVLISDDNTEVLRD
jgi:hypothetical protein